MSRLTKSGGKFVSRNIDDECTGMCGSCKRNTEIRHKLRYYEDLEEQLEKLYGGKMPLDEVVENLNRIVQNSEEKLDYARILTNAEAEKWDKWKDLEEQGRLTVIPETGIGDLSDGYHTFNELYHHRAVLFSVICNSFKPLAWKSKKHNDGTMYNGMFIVGIATPKGNATYHYDIEPYWDMFDVKELDKAPEWDGHTPSEAIERISKLTESEDE